LKAIVAGPWEIEGVGNIHGVNNGLAEE